MYINHHEHGFLDLEDVVSGVRKQNMNDLSKFFIYFASKTRGPVAWDFSDKEERDRVYNDIVNLIGAKKVGSAIK